MGAHCVHGVPWFEPVHFTSVQPTILYCTIFAAEHFRSFQISCRQVLKSTTVISLSSTAKLTWSVKCDKLNSKDRLSSLSTKKEAYSTSCYLKAIRSTIVDLRKYLQRLIRSAGCQYGLSRVSYWNSLLRKYSSSLLKLEENQIEEAESTSV